MNRRTFIQRCLAAAGGMYAVFVPGNKSKADVDKIINETLAEDPNWKSTKILEKPWHHSHFKGREFIACDRKIRWSVIGNPHEWSQVDYTKLPTLDACEDLINGEDKLYWLGSRELWEICYTGDHKQPFVFEYKGEIERFNKRIGYRTIA
jgi:hypothetical protein